MSDKTQLPVRARRGPNDPGRRDRIAQAALEVALEQGLGSVSHRTVAAAAGVPLGSTTYHFENLDALLVAAMELGMDRHRQVYEEWSIALSDCDQRNIASTLAELLVNMIEENQEQLKVEIELIVAAMRRPALREVSEPWANLSVSMLSRHVDEETAGVLALMIKGVLAEIPSKGIPDTESLAELMRRAMGNPGIRLTSNGQAAPVAV